MDNQHTDGFSMRIGVSHLAVIVTILVQSATAMYWAGNLTREVAHLSNQLDRVETKVEKLQAENTALLQRVAKVEK